MRKVGWVAGAPLATFAFLCGVWVMGCPAGAACLNVHGPMVLSFPLATTALILLTPAVFGWLVRAIWILRQSADEVNGLRRRPLPAALVASMGRTGAGHVECVEGQLPLAFCAGALRPTVFVTPALIDGLGAHELDAVLLHEQQHVEHREPLRRGLAKAATDVFFFIPLVTWWAQRRLEESELAADRAAIGQLGHRTVGRALWYVGVADAGGLPAFGGAIEARVAQVLGEPLEARRPSPSLWLTSVAGPILVVSTVVCLADVFAAVF